MDGDTCERKETCCLCRILSKNRLRVNLGSALKTRRRPVQHELLQDALGEGYICNLTHKILLLFLGHMGGTQSREAVR
jgi:hypothetical protein